MRISTFLKILLGNTEVWAFLEKLQCGDFEENERHIRNQHQKLNCETSISLQNNFPPEVQLRGTTDEMYQVNSWREQG